MELFNLDFNDDNIVDYDEWNDTLEKFIDYLFKEYYD